MSSAAKKRRHGSSSRKDLQDEDDDDDDELASHPNEIRIRRDPDIQFALKRANADHKLQSTMAHIIEKYSRNFEGIGDEIDMETGEIVVNNGHLRSMRVMRAMSKVSGWRVTAISTKMKESCLGT
jgi:hypothetical protein